MAAITSALIAIAGLVLGWIAIEIACKPCLERGREAIDQSLNPDYDPDDDNIRDPLNPNPDSQIRKDEDDDDLKLKSGVADSSSRPINIV